MDNGLSALIKRLIKENTYEEKEWFQRKSMQLAERKVQEGLICSRDSGRMGM